MRAIFWTVGLIAALATTAQAGPTRFYVVVRGVEEATGVASGIKDDALKLFKQELARHEELTLEAPPGLPKSDDNEEIRHALEKSGLKAIEVTLRILSVTKALNPPPPGKQYRVLLRGIKLSVFGDSLPDKVLAIGGSGEAQVGTEISSTTNIDKEDRPLLLDATKDAIKQAVDMTVAKLKLPESKKVKRRKI
jgi:hypothetical protein